MQLLSPTILVRAYRAGLFPMADSERGGQVALYRADPRGVMPIEAFRVPRSVARGISRIGNEIRIDTAFSDVVRACAEHRGGGVWLTDELARAYDELHRAGVAHSVESWDDGRLVGGLFGVALGGLFTSESMFHRTNDAGNHALVGTAAHLAERRYTLWDIQMVSPHTERFGAQLISAHEYESRLSAALPLERTFFARARVPTARHTESGMPGMTLR